MAVKEQIIRDIQEIQNPQVLNQLFGYVQDVKRKSPEFSNLDDVLQLAGTLDDQEADALRRMIDLEFEKIEGEW